MTFRWHELQAKSVAELSNYHECKASFLAQMETKEREAGASPAASLGIHSPIKKTRPE